jgi:HYR domain
MNITVVTNQPTATVWWREPIVYVDGTLANTAFIVSPDISPGGMFKTGVTQVIYRADNAVEQPTYCSFFITVQTLGN